MQRLNKSEKTVVKCHDTSKWEYSPSDDNEWVNDFNIFIHAIWVTVQQLIDCKQPVQDMTVLHLSLASVP